MFGKLHCDARKQCSLQTKACNAGTLSGKQVAFLESLQEVNVEVQQLLFFLWNMEAPFDRSEGDATTRLMQMELQLVQTQNRISSLCWILRSSGSCDKWICASRRGAQEPPRRPKEQ